MSSESFLTHKLRSTPEGRLVWIVSAVIVVIMIAYGATLIVNQQRQIREGIELRGLALARGMATIGATVAQDNLFLMQKAFTALGEQHDVQRAMVLAPDRMIVASNRSELIGRTLQDAAMVETESLQAETLMEGRAAGVDDQTLVIMEPLWSDSIIETSQGEPRPSLSPVSRKLYGWVRVELSLEAARREALRILIQQLLVTALLLFASIYGVNTTIRRLNRSLYASETRLRSIVETAGEGILVVDMTGGIESVNPAASYLLGINEQELIGRSLAQLVTLPSEVASLLSNQGNGVEGTGFITPLR